MLQTDTTCPEAGGGLYLADFGRLKLLESVRFFAHMHEASLPSEVVQDYEYSLRAAFSTKEYQKLIQEELNGQANFYQTFLAPFMVMSSLLIELSTYNFNPISGIAAKNYQHRFGGTWTIYAAFFA